MTLLFEPIEINESLILKNRIIMSPMCQYSAIDGNPSNWHNIHYITRAIGGVSAIIQEATAISPEGRITYGDLGIWNNDQIEAYSELVDEIKKYNCIPGIQLAHAGRKASCGKPWNNHHQIKPNEINGWKTYSSSNKPFYERDIPPIALSTEQINKIIDDFKQAAKRAIKAGYEILEIHAAHGYLIHQFYSPLINDRTDEYGGSFENRVRILLEIIEAIKSEVTTQSIWVRISASDWAEGGWNLDESKKLALLLQELGVDVIDVSTGGGVNHQQIKIEKEYQVPFAKEIKEISTMKVGAVGLIETGKEAEKLLQENKCDLIFIGRELLRNPYFPLNAAQELNGDIKWPYQYDRSKPKK